MTTRDLAGRSVLITRAADQAETMASAVRERGGTPILMPVVGVRFFDVPIDLTQADFLILTSVNAVEAVRRQHESIMTPVICVGSKTEAALGPEFRGRRHVPDIFRAEEVVALVQRLCKSAVSRHERADSESRRKLVAEGPLGRWYVVMPRAAHGRDVLFVDLAALGATVDAPIVYGMELRSPPPEEREAAERADIATFLSGATLEAFLAVVDAEYLRNRTVAVIGPVAAERAKALGIEVDVVPERATVEDLLDAIAEHQVTNGS